jgi:hypothetical protein
MKGRSKMTDLGRKAHSERMKQKNPMKKEDSLNKMKETLKNIGWKPSVRGGNGCGPTEPEKIILDLIPEITWNVVVPTKKKKGFGFPTCYKFDLGFPELKLLIEVDGLSHSSLERKKQDIKKQNFVEGLGWTVLRFSNEQVLKNTREVISTICRLRGILASL